MFTRVLAVITLMAAFSASALAQQWSSEQQEVWDFTTDCWEDWMAERVQKYLDECWADDISFWWSELALPFGKDWVSQADEWFSRFDNVMYAVQPHMIKVDGDVAIVHYQIMGGDEAASGGINFSASSRTDVLRKRNGGWKVIAVHQHKQPFGS